MAANWSKLNEPVAEDRLAHSLQCFARTTVKFNLVVEIGKNRGHRLLVNQCIRKIQNMLSGELRVLESSDASVLYMVWENCTGLIFRLKFPEEILWIYYIFPWA